jgi:hypothetical protein
MIGKNKSFDAVFTESFIYLKIESSELVKITIDVSFVPFVPPLPILPTIDVDNFE